MTQLKKSVNKDENNSSNESQNHSLKLTQSSNKEKTENIQHSEQQQTETSKVSVSQTIHSVKSPEDLAAWFFDVLGKNVTTRLRNNQYLSIPFTEESTEGIKWIEKGLKTIFSEDDLTEIAKRIGEFSLANELSGTQITDFETKIAELSDQNQKYQKRFNEYKVEIEDLEEELHKQNAETKGQLALADMLKYAFPERADTTAEKAFRTQLQRCVDTATPENTAFLANLLQAWPTVDFIHHNFDKDTEQNMNKIYDALAYLMSRISGYPSPERRPILDTLALWVSDWFEEFEFVSPERTLQADPAVHETSGLSSSNIKEGKSFAIIRKDTKKTVRYASITTY